MIFMSFAILTSQIESEIIDVQSLGKNETNIGFATLNCWFHKLTRCQYNNLYNDGWLELVAIFVCFLFNIVRLIQFIKKVF